MSRKHDPHDPPPHVPPTPPAPPAEPHVPPPAEERPEPTPNLPPQKVMCPATGLVMFDGCRVGVYVSGEDAATMGYLVAEPNLKVLFHAANDRNIDWSRVLRLRPFAEVHVK